MPLAELLVLVTEKEFVNLSVLVAQMDRAADF